MSHEKIKSVIFSINPHQRPPAARENERDIPVMLPSPRIDNKSRVPAPLREGERRPSPWGGEARFAGWRAFLEPEKLAAIAVLFWMSGPVAPLIPNLDDNLDAALSLSTSSMAAPSGLEDQILRLSWYPVYVVVLVLAHRYWSQIRLCAMRNALLLLLLGWTFLTVLWSVSPEDTLRRSVALALTTTFAVYLAVRFDTLTVVKLMAIALGIDAVGSAVCALAFPAIGVCHDAEYPGAWRGVFASKNQLGAMMLIECLGLSLLYLAERRRVCLLALAAAFALLLLSMSKTPLFIMLSLLPSLALVRRFFHNPRGFEQLLALALSLTAILLLLASTMIEPILALFGRDATLTGRTDIWELSWAAIQRRYWTGYGYGAFWSNPYGPATDVWDVLNWRVPSSHSGLLELWLGLGLIGVTLFGLLLLRSLGQILARARQGSCEECLWRLGYFILFVVHAVTEPEAMAQTSVAWALFIAVAVFAPRRTARAAPRSSAATAADHADLRRRVSARSPGLPARSLAPGP
jgi:exopolysaccharide production protein ExoQ